MNPPLWPCNKVLKPNFQSIISQTNNDCSLLSHILAGLLLLNTSYENIFALSIAVWSKPWPAGCMRPAGQVMVCLQELSLPKEFNVQRYYKTLNEKRCGQHQGTSIREAILKELKRNLRRKNKAAVNLKTGRFDNINSAAIISSVCKAVQNCKTRIYDSNYK